MPNLYLGLDSSTQSISATVIKEKREETKMFAEIIYETSMNFDAEFPGFGTANGVLPAPEGSGIAHTPPQLWVEALDGIFARMKKDGVELTDIRAIGVSGQQHGSVYLNNSAVGALSSLNPEKTLSEQLAGIYSRETSPIWMDSSTSEECQEIATALGGDNAVCELTGSRCIERFTGPQIRKFFKQQKADFEKTSHIALVSSFIPSILAGKPVPIDPGDGAGMNLMDIRTRQWNSRALQTTAPGLGEILLPVSPSHLVVSTISPYFRAKYNLNPDCKVIPGTGDNPSSLIGLGLVSSGKIGISLGTSDTLFAFMSAPNTDPTGQSHVFGSPTGHYMALSCHMNGSLAREAVKNQFNLSWEAFSDCLAQGRPGNEHRIMLPFFSTETIPKVLKPGVQKYGLDESSAQQNVQAVVEAQMTSMAMHAEWMKDTPELIYVTGGASANRAILRVMANVFNARVAQQKTTNAAGLGGAIRAQHAYLKAAGEAPDWDTLVSGFVSLDSIVEPDAGAVEAMKAFREVYRTREERYLNSNG